MANTSRVLPQPIFVVGANRSGTTWLSNLLCNHKQVAGVQSAEHFGILETNMFGRMEDLFGELDCNLNRCAFACTWSETDFFRRIGLDREWLVNELRENHSYPRIFRAAMDEYAIRNDKSHWLEKLPPYELNYIRELLPNAKVVAVTRKLFPNLRSKLQLLHNTEKQYSLVRATFEYVLQEKSLKKLHGLENVIFIAYEDVATRTAEQLEKVCRFIGIEYQSQLQDNRFARNSSYSTATNHKSSNEVSLSLFQKFVVLAIYFLASSFPSYLLNSLFLKFKNSRTHFISGSFSEFESGIDQENC